MSILNEIRVKNISEVLHFTLDTNLIGIVAHGGLLSREALDSQHISYLQLEFVNDIIWPDRSRDSEWLSHINLSIESVNQVLLNRAKNNHPNHDWFILAFAPEILTHDEVYFTTTNNAYLPHVQRGRGCEGFLLPFISRYRDKQGNLHNRRVILESRFPTSQQAEALYPGYLGLQYLNKIYVENHEAYLRAQVALEFAPFMPQCPALTCAIEINPLKFISNLNQESY